jgi:hypothetical protein
MIIVEAVEQYGPKHHYDGPDDITLFGMDEGMKSLRDAEFRLRTTPEMAGL